MCHVQNQRTTQRCVCFITKRRTPLLLHFYESRETTASTATVYRYIRLLRNVFQYLLIPLAVCLKLSVCFNCTTWPTTVRYFWKSVSLQYAILQLPPQSIIKTNRSSKFGFPGNFAISYCFWNIRPTIGRPLLVYIRI